jgi:hypothetical protein
MSSCSNKAEIVNSSNVKSIAVVLNDEGNNSSFMQIISSNSIKSILSNLNDAHPEPIKFYPTHRLNITYADGKQLLVLCSGSSMKVEARTYKMKKTIRNILTPQ